ncbi:4Fe-4S binding protein, partial [Butyricimonas sp. An62]
MLRRIRLIVALVFFILITLLFLDFTGTLHAWFGWLAKIQFLPAVLALNVGVILLWVVLTLVFGRVYCSVICPLGVFQDVVSWFSGRRKKKKYRFSYSPAVSWLRYGMLGVFIIAMIAGIGSVVALLAPYSSYGRIVSNLFAPVYQWGNNVLAYFAERSDSYAFYETSVWLKSLPTFIIAAVTFVALVVLAWRNGRTYCNTICPVGTVLGFFSRYSLFRPEIDAEKCTNCSLCSRKCKAACINYKDHRIDYSRCVTCMDCIDSCKHGAISYKYRFGKKEIKETSETGNTNNARRSFLTGMGLVLVSSAVKAQEKKVDGGLAVILDKKVPARTTPLVPPGAKGLRNMRTRCTGCQLCVSVCPNQVLRPSTKLETLMQPEMSYERGYCRPECTKCSEVCPAGAILKL